MPRRFGHRASRRRAPHRYRRLNRGLLGMLAVYLVLAVGAEMKQGRHEIFPFASWSLFSKVPNEVDDFSVLIVEVDGEPLAKPVWWERDNKLLVYAQSHDARMFILDMGKHYLDGDTDEFDSLRSRFEKLFLVDHGAVTYEIRRRWYDPMERIDHPDAFLRTEPIGSYEYHRELADAGEGGR